MDVIFYVIAIFLIVIVIALIVGEVNRLFGHYGGIIGTVITFVINAVEFGFIFWLIGKIVPVIDYKLGIYIGIFYWAYCWIFDEENKMADFVFDIFSR